MSADHPLLPRRRFLTSAAGGLGHVALAWLLARDRGVAANAVASPAGPTLHHRPRAKRIVQVFCCGPMRLPRSMARPIARPIVKLPWHSVSDR